MLTIARPWIATTLALGLLASPTLARGDLEEDLGFGGVNISGGAAPARSQVLEALGGTDRPMELAGSLGRLRAAVEQGLPFDQQLEADYEMVRAYANRSPEALRFALVTVDGDDSLDALLGSVVPEEGADEVVAAPDPMALEGVRRTLQALSADLFMYKMGGWLQAQGAGPAPVLGADQPEGGLGDEQLAMLTGSYQPAFVQRIVSSSAELESILR